MNLLLIVVIKEHLPPNWPPPIASWTDHTTMNVIVFFINTTPFLPYFTLILFNLFIMVQVIIIHT